MSDGDASSQASVEPAEAARTDSGVEDVEALPFDDDDPAAAGAGRQWFGRLRNVDRTPVRLALVVGAASAVAMTGLCGWLGYRAHEAQQQQDQRQLLLQVGRQGAVNLTTIDYEHADADVKRILDSATGQFYEEFSTRSAPFIEVLTKTQSKSVGTVTEAGIESVEGQEGQILVAVSVGTSNRGTPDNQPRYWRMRLTVTKQGADTKVSKVEFVP